MRSAETAIILLGRRSRHRDNSHLSSRTRRKRYAFAFRTFGIRFNHSKCRDLYWRSRLRLEYDAREIGKITYGSAIIIFSKDQNKNPSPLFKLKARWNGSMQLDAIFLEHYQYCFVFLHP